MIHTEQYGNETIWVIDAKQFGARSRTTRISEFVEWARETGINNDIIAPFFNAKIYCKTERAAMMVLLRWA